MWRQEMLTIVGRQERDYVEQEVRKFAWGSRAHIWAQASIRGEGCATCVPSIYLLSPGIPTGQIPPRQIQELIATHTQLQRGMVNKEEILESSREWI